MNTAEASLFLYSLQMLLDDHLNQKKVVFKYNNHYLTAKLYESNPFEENVNKIKFRKSFISTFLENDPLGEKKERLQKNLPATFIQLKKFVLKNKIKVSDLVIVLQDVSLLDDPAIHFPFLLTDEKDSLNPVSFLND